MNRTRTTLLVLIAAASAPPALGTLRNGEPALPDLGAELYGRLPLAFVENAGQWNTPARFVACMDETVVRVEDGGFVVDARREESEERLLLRFDFVGSSGDSRPVGEELLPGVRNYYIGNDPERWRSGVRGYARVAYPDLYQGVGLRLREADGLLEYDLCLDPGADVSQVVVRCDGVDGLSIDEAGGLLMQSALGELRQTPPRTWCVLPSGEEEPLECEFVVLGPTSFGFRLAERDPSLPVVIDPGLEWATYLGGSADDWLMGVARMPSGEIVVTGFTKSLDFPPGLPAVGLTDGFVSILDATGSTLVASTLLGGSGGDIGSDVQVGANGEVFVVGGTNSPDFPVTQDTAYMRMAQGANDAFVVQLDSSLNLVYGSYLGGTGYDMGARLLVRAPRVLTLGGNTRSTDFPVTAGTAVQSANGGGNSDYFLCRLDLDQPPASQLQYGTYLGGSAQEGPTLDTFGHKSLGLHEDASGVVTLAGRTESADIPTTPNGYDPLHNGGRDAYVAIVDPTVPGLDGLLYATYIGGNSNEAANAFAVDSTGVVTLGGYTYSPGFPTTIGAYDTNFVGPAGYNDAFVLRLDPGISTPQDQLIYSTFLSGSGFETVFDLALGADGSVVAQGFSGDEDLADSTFPTTCSGFQPDFGGSRDGFVVYLDPAGNGASDLLYSTFIGGPGWDVLVFGLTILSESPTLKVLGGGGSGTAGFPTTAGAYQRFPAGQQDAVLLQLEINPHTYCVAAGNSASPDGALICGSGSVGIADNDFTLSAAGAPPNQTGVFFYGPQQFQLPFGDGFRCVGPGGVGIFRLNPPLVIDGAGSVLRPVDFTQPPAGAGAGQITAGSTWYFQLWYRDPAAGGSGHNLSNGLKATFYP